MQSTFFHNFYAHNCVCVCVCALFRCVYRFSYKYTRDFPRVLVSEKHISISLLRFYIYTRFYHKETTKKTHRLYDALGLRAH